MPIATMPIGTLISRIHRQDSASVSSPPMIPPAAPPTAPIAPQVEIALVRYGPSANEVVRIVSVAGETIAAPSPCTTRAATSMPPVVAAPPTRLASVNRAMPAMNTRRRPYRSAARPPSSRNPAEVIT